MIWKLIARFLARPTVAQWLITRAMRTPYLHITSADGLDIYMARYWLFNPYEHCDGGPRQFKWFPWSIRIHHIRLADQDRDLHDHPWNARTFILQGNYVEERENPEYESALPTHAFNSPIGPRIRRSAGDTARLNFGEFHRIDSVSTGGVWTLFVSGPYQGTWGFLVDGVKVKWRDYLEARKP